MSEAVREILEEEDGFEGLDEVIVLDDASAAMISPQISPSTNQITPTLSVLSGLPLLESLLILRILIEFPAAFKQFRGLLLIVRFLLRLAHRDPDLVHAAVLLPVCIHDPLR